MNNQKKKLPIGNAPIKYLMRFFVPLMIAFLNPDEVAGWFYSSHILTKVRRKTYKLWMIFQNFNPFILRIPLFFLSSFWLSEKLLMKILKVLIDHNWYILLHTDFYYLNESIFYQEKHFNHSVLVYGYDLQENTVNLCGYCFGSKIKCVDVNINNFIESFFSCKQNKAWVYRRRKRKKSKFNKRFFYLGVKGYAKSSCPLEYQVRAKSFSAMFREYYGINAHKQLKNDLVFVLNGEKKDLKLRIYAYLELAECMSERLKYLQKDALLKNTEHIIERFDLLKNEYQKMINLFLKYNLTGDKDLIKRLIVLENIQSEEEQRLYTELLNIIKVQYNYK